MGAKGKLPDAWFRIKGIPLEKRSIPNVCRVSSLVGRAKQIDKENILKFDYVRVLIQCREPSKVPAVLEGVLGDYLYDFSFTREIPQEGTTNPVRSQWIRNDKTGGNEGADGNKEEQQTKKPRMENSKPQNELPQSNSKSNNTKMQSAPPKFMADAQRAYKCK